MAKPSLPTRCDYLQGYKTADASPDRFTNSVHVDKQVDWIDHHIHEMFELRSAFLHRSNQLVSSFYVIPPEIMSHIFQEVVRVESGCPCDLLKHHRFSDLRQAFVLSSVSRSFRQVALATPELWNRLELELPSTEQATNVFAPLLQHCVSHISNLYLGIKLRFFSHPDAMEEEVRLMTQTILSPDIIPKVNHLVLHFAPDWILPTLHSLPALDTLAINEMVDVVDLNLEAHPLRRVSLSQQRLKSITLLPSIQILYLDNVPGDAVIYIRQQQCPNSVECPTGRVKLRRCSTSRHPLTLHHLKQLAWIGPNRLPTIRRLRMPSLERLRLESLHGHRDIDTAMISLCQQVSTTLISLTLGGLLNFGDDGLRQICRLDFPRLECLKFDFRIPEILFDAIEALLSQAENENDSPGVNHMPRLRELHLEHFWALQDPPKRLSHLVVDLLKQRRFGETSHFHLDFYVRFPFDYDLDELWPLELREELRLTIHGRNLTLTRNGSRIEWLQ